jgi:hypothetical protein
VSRLILASPGSRRCKRFNVAVLGAAFALACRSDHHPERRDLPARPLYIAMERDFQNFRAWGSASVPDSPGEGQTHPKGARHVYVNALPTTGRSEFPVGTMIVKEAAPDGSGRVRLFAMVKRGGGFNASGASGWEWFELEEHAEQGVHILWRGLGAPDGESYGGDPEGTCNSCHRRGEHSDFVKSAALSLKLR